MTPKKGMEYAIENMMKILLVVIIFAGVFLFFRHATLPGYGTEKLQLLNTGCLKVMKNCERFGEKVLDKTTLEYKGKVYKMTEICRMNDLDKEACLERCNCKPKKTTSTIKITLSKTQLIGNTENCRPEDPCENTKQEAIEMLTTLVEKCYSRKEGNVKKNEKKFCFNIDFSNDDQGRWKFGMIFWDEVSDKIDSKGFIKSGTKLTTCQTCGVNYCDDNYGKSKRADRVFCPRSGWSEKIYIIYEPKWFFPDYTVGACTGSECY